MLTFPLKKEWYEKIKSGEKTIEYREIKPYWTRRIVLNFFRPMFGLYSPEEVLRRFHLCAFHNNLMLATCLIVRYGLDTPEK